MATHEVVEECRARCEKGLTVIRRTMASLKAPSFELANSKSGSSVGPSSEPVILAAAKETSSVAAPVAAPAAAAQTAPPVPIATDVGESKSGAAHR